jgi:type IV fimbrial biogenesis protein FimT
MEAQRGWTLIELLLVMVALATVSGIAVSSFLSALESSRAGAVRSDLLASLSLAGSRAGVSGTRAVLCPSFDAATCSDSPDWSRGWLVFMDPNASRELDGGERVLARQERLPGRVRLRSTAGRVRIVFQGNGGNAGSNVTFTLCDGRGPGKAQALVLANDGHLRYGTATAANIAATCAR